MEVDSLERQRSEETTVDDENRLLESDSELTDLMDECEMGMTLEEILFVRFRQHQRRQMLMRQKRQEWLTEEARRVKNDGKKSNTSRSAFEEYLLSPRRNEIPSYPRRESMDGSFAVGASFFKSETALPAQRRETGRDGGNSASGRIMRGFGSTGSRSGNHDAHDTMLPLKCAWRPTVDFRIFLESGVRLAVTSSSSERLLLSFALLPRMRPIQEPEAVPRQTSFGVSSSWFSASDASNQAIDGEEDEHSVESTSKREKRDGDGDGDGDGGRRVRRYVTTTKQLGDGYLSPLNKKYSKMSEAQLEQVIIKESERFKLEMALWDEQLEALNNTAAAAEEEQRVVASEQAVLLASMKQWDSRSQKDKLSAKNASSGRPLEDGSVALTR